MPLLCFCPSTEDASQTCPVLPTTPVVSRTPALSQLPGTWTQQSNDQTCAPQPPRLSLVPCTEWQSSSSRWPGPRSLIYTPSLTSEFHPSVSPGASLKPHPFHYQQPTVYTWPMEDHRDTIPGVPASVLPPPILSKMKPQQDTPLLRLRWTPASLEGIGFAGV